MTDEADERMSELRKAREESSGEMSSPRERTRAVLAEQRRKMDKEKAERPLSAAVADAATDETDIKRTFPEPEFQCGGVVDASELRAIPYGDYGEYDIRTPPLPPVAPYIVSLARDGRKVQAIKEYRSDTGLSISEAKFEVERALEADEALDGLRKKLDPTHGEILYVSGPMRGYPEYNYPLFNTVSQRLRVQGYDVRNPAENFYPDPPGSHTFAQYMQLDLQNVMDSTGVVLLPGWRNSEGAKLEVAMAHALGRKFYDYIDKPGGGWSIDEIEDPDFVSNGIEATARKLVYGDRNESYGPPEHDFACTGRIWAAILSAHTGQTIPDIPPEIVGIMMAGLKVARMSTNPTHLDSRVDVIGYILCVDRIVTKDGIANGPVR